VYNSLLVLAYVENPADCPLVRFIFTNLVAKHATKSYTTTLAVSVADDLRQNDNEEINEYNILDTIFNY
jgi:hypothetical protein